MQGQIKPDNRQLCHAINNHMNAIVVGMSILEQHDSQDVRDIAQLLQNDVNELQKLLAQIRKADSDAP